MKIELVETGLDECLNVIEKDLKAALTAKTKMRKDELVYHALGAVNAIYHLVDVIEETESGSME